MDNDIAPAQRAGLRTALIRRGPWASILRDPVVEARCLFQLTTLAELPDLLREHNDGSLAPPTAGVFSVGW